MVLGGLYHAGAACIDLGLPWRNNELDELARAANQGTDACVDPALPILGITPVGIDKALAEYRTDPTYMVHDSPMLDLMRKDAIHILTRYSPKLSQYQPLMVEEPLKVKLFDHILHVIPDKIVRDLHTNHVWVVERKTTERDDAQWLRQWRLNFQTTAEVIAAELHLDEAVQGVMLEQVIVSRQRSKSHLGALPQQMSSNSPRLLDWRPISKSKFIKEEAKLYFRDCVKELLWRARSKRDWTPNYTSCPKCDLQVICTGQQTIEETLVPMRDRP